MGQAPYDEADPLELMRADASQVRLVSVSEASSDPPDDLIPSGGGFAVPAGAADLGGRLHYHLD